MKWFSFRSMKKHEIVIFVMLFFSFVFGSVGLSFILDTFFHGGTALYGGVIAAYFFAVIGCLDYFKRCQNKAAQEQATLDAHVSEKRTAILRAHPLSAPGYDLPIRNSYELGKYFLRYEKEVADMDYENGRNKFLDMQFHSLYDQTPLDKL